MRALKLGCIDAHRAKVTKAYVLAIPVFPSRLGLGSVDNDVCVKMQSKGDVGRKVCPLLMCVWETHVSGGLALKTFQLV